MEYGTVREARSGRPQSIICLRRCRLHETKFVVWKGSWKDQKILEIGIWNMARF